MELSQHEELASGPAFTDEDLSSTASADSGAGPMDEEGRGGETKEDEDDLAGGDDEDEDEEDEDEEDDEDIVQDLLGSQRSESSLGGTLDALMGRVQATDLTSSTLDALQQTENKVVGLLEIAAQTATELARVDATDETRDRLRSHIDSFLATTHEIHQTLREQIKLIPPALPFEGHSYDAKMDFEITKMQTYSVRARLGRLLAHIEQQQLAFRQQATTNV